MTTSDHLRLHPWLPVLVDPGGRVRLRLDHFSRPLPHDLTTAVTASARHVRQTHTAAADGPGWRTLVAAGHVIDSDDVARSAAVGGDALARAHLSRHAVTPDHAGRVRRRAAQRVAVTGPDVLVAPLTATLTACGIPLSGPGVTPTLVVHVGRPNASTIHDWMLTGVPHLVVIPRAAAIRVGPLVHPGASACLQCLSLARGEQDASWPLLAERLARLPVPTPDALLVAHTAALVARAVVELAETSTSALTGSYWVVELDDPLPRRVPVARHPTCGCWWPVAPSPAPAGWAATSAAVAGGSQ